MELFEALYTTRAMRRVRPDPIPHQVQAAILDAAIRAPSGGNQQNWRFLLVDDPATKAQLAPLYRAAMALLWKTIYKAQLDLAEAEPENPESIQFLRVQASANWLAENFEAVPLFLFSFAKDDSSGSSLYPATWSAMLAARAHGIGSCLTMVLAFHNAEVFDILGVPPDEGWSMGGCVSLGYATGRWGVASARQPVDEVSFINRWGAPTSFGVVEPLWPAQAD